MSIYFSSHDRSLIGLPFRGLLLSVVFVHVTCAMTWFTLTCAATKCLMTCAVFCCRPCGRILSALFLC